MKRILFTLFASLLIVSCIENNVSNKSEMTKSTKLLTSFFKKYKEQQFNVGNDIQKEELYNKREKELLMYIDSFAILSNLQGRISDISISDIGNTKSKILTYDIEINPEKYFELTFKCTHIINKDSLDKNYFYNTIKSISDYSTVYFDGIFAVKVETNTPYSVRYDKNLSFSYPEYKFHVTNISTNPLDTLSDNLIKSIRYGRKTINYMLKDYRKEKDFKKSIFNKLSNEFNQSKDILTEKEHDYINLYMNLLASDIL